MLRVIHSMEGIWEQGVVDLHRPDSGFTGDTGVQMETFRPQRIE